MRKKLLEILPALEYKMLSPKFTTARTPLHMFLGLREWVGNDGAFFEMDEDPMIEEWYKDLRQECKPYLELDDAVNII